MPSLSTSDEPVSYKFATACALLQVLNAASAADTEAAGLFRRLYVVWMYLLWLYFPWLYLLCLYLLWLYLPWLYFPWLHCYAYTYYGCGALQAGLRRHSADGARRE